MGWQYYWWFISPILGGAAAATILEFTKGYFHKRGENIATQHDIHMLQNQLRENTEITRTIERSFSREDFLWRSELAFREKQLAEFYGPVYGTLKSQVQLYWLWINGQMNEMNFEVKKLMSRQNEFVRKLIIDKAHLIDGSVMPESFVHFVTSTLVFDLYAAPTNEGTIPSHLSNLEIVKFPESFLNHITETTERLKARVEILHKKYATSLDTEDILSSPDRH